MAYVKTNWKTGDTITADKLNNIENGIASYGGGGGGMLLTISQSGDDTVLDKNYNEIKAAIESGILPFAIDMGDYNDIYLVYSYAYTGGKYGVALKVCGGDEMMFLSDTDDGVLILSE